MNTRYGPLPVVVFLVLAFCSAAPAATFTVTNNANHDIGSLAWAILQANITADKDTIWFAIPPVGSTATIALTNMLPNIISPMTIDGWSQVGGARCEAGVEIDGGGSNALAGLAIQLTTNCDIMGLCINRMEMHGIYIQGGGDHRIFGCFIGTDPAGTADLGNGWDGIAIVNSSNNLIGLLPTYSCTNRNIISGNESNGVLITGSGSWSNLVQNNHIGTDISGAAPLPNGGNGVIIVADAHGNSVGSVASPKPVNVISGNASNGVMITQASPYNYVYGNAIGTTRDGQSALGNTADGVNIRASDANEVGNSGGEAQNVISGNGDDGVEISDIASHGNMIRGNYIGTTSNGLAALGNEDDGVAFYEYCSQNQAGDSLVLGRNIISGNRGCGVSFDEQAEGNYVYGNYIGPNRDGLDALTNREHGVYIGYFCRDNHIGGTNSGEGNVISGNGRTNWFNGVHVESNARANTIAGNLIGLNVNNAPLPNAGDGVQIVNAWSNTVGGIDFAARNVISGNGLPGDNPSGGDGVQIGSNAVLNTVAFNYIGTDTNGSSPRPNLHEGVFIYNASTNLIGADVAGIANVISGNQGSGVKIGSSPLATSNVLARNVIGLALDGTTPLGNSDHGVHIVNAPSNKVGGIGGVFGGGNILSGNGLDGVLIEGAQASGNMLGNNRVGTDLSGFWAVSNGFDGISVQSAPDTLVLNNIVAGNGRYGILLTGTDTRRTRVGGNWIGRPAGGGIPNGHSGVVLHNGASDNVIGGTNAGLGNVIADNANWGVLVLLAASTNNSILGNSIYGNGSLGIGLNNDGITFNDDLDADLGPNHQQNYPVIYSATTGSVALGGTLGSEPGKTYRIEFFLSTSRDVTGFGEGQTYLGFTNVTTESDGSVSNCFLITFPDAAVTGEYITATATDPSGNTSEFGPAAEIVPNEEYDADGDGMPGVWETGEGLDPYDRTGDEGAEGDPDTDRVPNYEEYVADTGPNDESNYLHIVEFLQTNETFVTYTSTNTRYYTVGRAAEPTNEAPWTILYEPAAQGSNGVTTACDTNPSPERAFYRVQVVVTP